MPNAQKVENHRFILGILGLCEKPRIVITIRGFSSASWGFFCACALSQNISTFLVLHGLSPCGHLNTCDLSNISRYLFQYTKPYTDIAPIAYTQCITRFLSMIVLIHIPLLHQLRIHVHVKHFKVSSYHIIFNTQIQYPYLFCVY